ncbi:TIGR03986 family CRISPR-associated RAMP protein [Neptunomonas sp.]|uniref:TIGR03986 family type III CRISPR-associated RAMP protein n=1 Tax=Neptunomonas sp. TaxID=1971898 RepID=UPI0035648AE0
MSIHTPYNFVPLSRFIFLPHWADQVSHDMPFSDGVSGTLHVEMTCHTHILVGGQQKPATDKEPGLVEFFKAPDGTPVIPGSTIKGALSNVLEIASFARFNRLDDKRYSVRDLSTSDNFFTKQFISNPKGGKPGWLKYNTQAGCWQITPCKMARILQSDIIKACDDVTERCWIDKKNAKAHQRYELLGGFRGIKFITSQHKNKGVTAVPDKQGQYEGKIVVTGQPGKVFNNSTGKINKNKKWEFVFYSPASESKTVPLSVIRDFKFIHNESEDWKYWEQKKAAYSEQGVPVFYMENSTQIASMGLSFLYKLAYKNTTHDAVKHTQASHIDATHPDLPALVFGQIDEGEGHSLRGRVNIGSAQLKGEAEYEPLPATILNGPKPTYYPAYVRQDKGDGRGQLATANDYKTLMDKNAELAGWKRYQVWEDVEISRLDAKQLENTKVQVKLLPLKQGAQFCFKIHFHNLREAELGALLWSLDFGEKEGVFHNIGMGKPFGMGRTSLRITGSDLQTMSADQQQGNALLKKARFSFTHLMNSAYSEATEEHSWQESPQLNELYAMAAPRANPNQPYMQLNEYTNSTKTDNLNVLQSATKEEFKSLDLPVNAQAEPNKSINLLTDERYEAVQAEQHAAGEAAQKAAQEAKAREERRARLSEEARQVFDLESLAQEFLQNKDNNSARDALNKLMQQSAKEDFIKSLGQDTLLQCHEAIQPLHEAGVLPNQKQLKKLQKALDKVLE